MTKYKKSYYYLIILWSYFYFRFIPPVETLQFFSSDGGETIDAMQVPFMLPADPSNAPLMYRDLNMDNPPEMPEDCLS